MPLPRIALTAAFAAGLAALPLAKAEAQLYPPCSPFPLTWPFCAVEAAAAIVTAPFRALAPRPYYYGYAYYGRPYYPPAYPPPPYAAPPYYGQP
jgi:hypothetical protein